MKILAAALLGAAWVVAAASAAACDLATAPSTRWSVENEHGVAWLRTPCGDRILAIGVNVVDAGASGAGLPRPHYDGRDFAPSRAAWAAHARQRLLAWGFNSAGAWSLPPRTLGLPTAINLELGRLARFHWFDPFDPAMARRMDQEARRLTRPFRRTSLRLGYFSDNEVGWWGGALFLFFAQKPASNHTKQRWVDMLRTLYHDDWRAFVADFVPPSHVKSWPALLRTRKPTRLRPGGDGSRAVRQWTAIVAERYYALAAAAIRKADPDALYLGDRLPIYFDPDAVRAEARHVDAIAVNYNVDSPEGWIAPYFFDGLRQVSTGKPVFVSEWFYAARDNRSGNRNNGQLMTVDTQAERATGAAAAARGFAAIPNLIGLDWFQYYDYPQGGRADGEDYDFGLVDIHDRPYARLVAALSEANRALPRIHATARALTRPTRADFAAPFVRIDPSHHSLVDWPKPASLLPALRAAPGDVPFGEAYLGWSERGLAVATIGEDYFDPALLAYRGTFPLSEAYRLEFDVDAGAGPRRFVLYVVPPPRSAHGAAMTVALCAGEAATASHEGCQRVPHAAARFFGADQPRIVAEAVIPWAALGTAGPPASHRIRFEVSARSWYRARWMSLSGRVPEADSVDPAGWADLRLAAPPQ